MNEARGGEEQKKNTRHFIHFTVQGITLKGMKLMSYMRDNTIVHRPGRE